MPKLRGQTCAVELGLFTNIQHKGTARQSRNQKRTDHDYVHVHDHVHVNDYGQSNRERLCIFRLRRRGRARERERGRDRLLVSCGSAALCFVLNVCE